MRKGDYTWSTIILIMGYIIDTTAKTITLPEDPFQCLAEILASVPCSQKIIGVTKWHKVLRDLRSMALDLPGAQNLFGNMQLTLSKKHSTRISLKKGLHQSLTDFEWLLDNVSKRPTWIAELIPLLPSALGPHDASKVGDGGVWVPTD